VTLTFVVVACGSREAPPDEGGTGGTGWHLQHVPECGYAVEMRGPATRTDLTNPAAPGVTEIAYLADALGATCTAFTPEAAEVPTARADIEQILRGAFRRIVTNTDGVVDPQITLDPGAPRARYRITLATGVALVGVILVDGRNVHEISAAVGKHRASEAEATYFFASYRAIPAP
jgi:hypothetical protein